MVGGGTPSKKNDAFWTGGDIPWVSPKDMRSREVWDAKDHITEAAVDGSATQVVPEGSVLLVVRSGILVRRVPIAVARVPVALNQDMKALLPGGPLEPDYLAYALEAQAEHILAGCVKRGATVHSIDISKFSGLQFTVPPPSEQHRIIEILDQADELRRLRAEADAKAERILPALFMDMFGDPATNPMGWPTGRLDDVVVDTQYGTSQRADTSGAGIAVIRMNNITKSGELDLTDLKYVRLSDREVERHLLRQDDILFNRTNSAELVGKTGIWRDQRFEAVPASYLIRVRVDEAKAIPRFVWAFMNSPFIKRTLLGKARRAIGMSNINATELRALPLVLPDITSQGVFVQLLSAIDLGTANRRDAAGKIESIFGNLLHRAFSGDLVARWREAHMKELLQEMEEQARLLGLSSAEVNA